MLVKPTTVQLLDKAENRYRLVIATAKRARQISQGDTPLVKTKDTAPVTIAADEIEAGKLVIYNEEEWEKIDDTQTTELVGEQQILENEPKNVENK